MAHRFEHEARDAFDDSWGTLEESAAEPQPAVKTEVRFEDAKSVLSENDSPDIPFDRSLNPYRGCEHGCIYCFARPTHSYFNLSPGLDFETKLIAKRNIVKVLRAELGKKGYRPSQIAIGTATDCYQPIERDLDLIGPMAADRLAAVYVTITTLDGDLARKLEPRAAAPHRRLRTIRALADAGVPVGVSVAPQIPFLNDDMEQVLEAAWEAGARCAFYTVIRLPWEVAPLFREWLDLPYPQRAARIMARIQEMRGGKDYDADFATRMKGSGLWAELIRQRFEKATNRIGFERKRIAMDLTAFRPPGALGQGNLF